LRLQGAIEGLRLATQDKEAPVAEAPKDVKVKYIPVINYVAAVTGFRTKDLDLVWFGGLSGVQAR